jgi:hypothetical protein
VFLPFSKQSVDEANGTFHASEANREAAGRLLAELQKWAVALRPLHEK